MNRAAMLSFRQFRYGFANAVPKDVAQELYDRYVVPAPVRPLFEVLFATFGPGKATRVDTTARRGPLLIIGVSVITMHHQCLVVPQGRSTPPNLSLSIKSSQIAVTH